MLARVKLKGIDGGPHKRWSMWFNSMQREEPYQGGAWLSSARVVRCWTAGYKPEEGGDDVKSACPLHPGLHTCYIGRDNEMQICKD
eukprot:scaffold14262_cov2903-Alexandrium_tamarense.AAC.1